MKKILCSLAVFAAFSAFASPYLGYESPKAYVDSLGIPKKNEMQYRDNKGTSGTFTWYDSNGRTDQYLDSLNIPKKREMYYKDNKGNSSQFSWFE
ncbi:hypothetical protein LCGC14_1027850 [marine sediment metagenome]|uniref:Uncharacterized protein n=1 Tax=marine sediment metagenome TaxID=412755 RepID=A0A0F9N061_9ZZZZ|nr:hypothetical protein [Candidatus Aminicenantes bacterium]